MDLRVSEVDVGGSPEPGYLVSPANPTGAGLIYLHWFDEAPNANRTQFLDEARSLATLGATSILPQLGFPWRSAPSGLDSDSERIGSELSSLRSALEIVRSADGVDPSRIAVVGHDFGAMYGCLLMSGFEAACGVLIAPTPRWADWFLPFWPIDGDRFDYMRGLAELDPIGALDEITAPLLFQFGKQDFYIAPMTGAEMFRAASEPKQLLSYEVGHDLEDDQAKQDRFAFLTRHLLLSPAPD